MNLCAAIASKCLVSFMYDGHQRIVIPAAFGRHKSSGKPMLRGYQVRGTSGSGSVPNWRIFELGKMQNVVAIDETFSTNPPGYQRGDSHLKVECEL